MHVRRVVLNGIVFVASLLARHASGADILINITGPGSRAEFIQEGHTSEEPVQARVGDRIKWINGGNTTHTATAVRTVNGQPLFDTGDLTRNGGSSGFIEMTPALYAAAGGQPMATVNIDFECLYHGSMQSTIVLAAVDAPVNGRLRSGRGALGAGARMAPLVRKNVNSLSTSEIDSLRRGVAVMKSRPVSDRKSWQYWANIHGTSGTSTDPLWSQCEHSSRFRVTIHFLTWHRAYLHHFEQVLREASGDSNLTLPYWNWTADRTLPIIYRVPRNTTNSLWEQLRQMNDGSALPRPIVESDLNMALRQSSYRNFSLSLEGSPHGTVHTLVGGTGGTMSTTDTSANDPIFWAHHANIDRLWNRWLEQSGHVNPSDATFLDKSYTFVALDGTDVTVRVGDMIDNLALGYRYDDDPTPPSPPPSPLRGPNGRPGDDGVALGFEPHTVSVALPSQTLDRLRTIPTDGSKLKTWIDVNGIKFDEPPNFVYGVYLNLPKGDVSEEQLEAHYVGSISLFGHAPRKTDKHQEEGTNSSLDATEAIHRLRNRGEEFGKNVDVTLRPITLAASKDQASALRSANQASAVRARLKYESISLRSSAD